MKHTVVRSMLEGIAVYNIKEGQAIGPADDTQSKSADLVEINLSFKQ